MTQLAVSGASVDFGATKLFSDITFTVGKGDRWGIIGRNGTGKTTLFKLITGAQAPTRGQVTRIGGLRISMLEQHRTFGDATTVWEAAAGPFSELLALERSLTEQTDALGAAGDAVTEQMLARYSRDLERFEQEGGYTFAPRIDAVLHGLGFDPTKAREQTLASLSGGERGRVGLARQLVAPVDVLLLDEPTNHLDLETTRWLEEYLRTADLTVLLISHDRAFLDAVVDHVLHLEADTAFAYVGGFASFATQRAERRLTQERAAAKQAKKIASEEDYIRRNIAGQNTRQAKGRRKLLARLPRLSAPGGAEGTMSLRLESGERGGDQVVVADDVTITVGDRVLLENFSVRVGRGDVIGFVGPNGAGKSTLLKSIVGARPVQGGELRVGGSIQVAYYYQELEQVPLDKTLYDIINDLRPTWTRGQIQGHLGRFGFSGDEAQRQPRTLSGGERSRVALAMIMLSRANLLIFDEPTNHLDVESIEALEDAIDEYDGTVILVSHDRALLRALATRVWVLHDRRITDFPGTFAEWETASRERDHAASVAAAEEESLRRMHEKQKTQRKETSSERMRSSSRQARRALAEAEAAVERLEGQVATLTATLEDPDLYVTPEGTKRATGLGKDLDRARAELDAALAVWAEATEQAERAGA